MPLHNLERNTQKRESKMICNESTKCCCTWESSTHVDGRLGGPFIAPREPLAVGSSNGKQSAFPVYVSTRLRTIADFLPFLAKPTVAATALVVHRIVRWHTGQSGVTFRPLVKSTCRPLIARLTIGVGATDSPDSPVHTRQSAEFKPRRAEFFPRAASSPGAPA